MKNVKEIMHGMTIVDPDISILEAAKIMTHRKIGSILVRKRIEEDISADKKYFGIVTERDIVRLVSLNKDLRILKVHEVMNSIITIDHTKDSDDAVNIMLKNKIRRLPVTRNGEIIGIITMKDIVRQKAVHIASKIYTHGNYLEGSSWG
jgi:CBS domain-containing protein